MSVQAVAERTSRAGATRQEPARADARTAAGPFRVDVPEAEVTELRLRV